MSPVLIAIFHLVVMAIDFQIRGVKESGTATNFPVGFRATVQETTQEGLTSGFDMGPGRTPPLWPCTTLPSNAN